MHKFVIEGGRPLDGTISTAGAKNAVLPIMCASLLSAEPLTIRNVPKLSDVKTMGAILNKTETGTETNADGSLTLHAAGPLESRASWDEVRKMRASVTVMGPLLAREGKCQVAMPGGCVFGVRPVDLHLKGMEALGAKITLEKGYIQCDAPAGGLRGASVYLAGPMGPTVLGTANVMMAATLAKGVTTIHGAACEPEVVDLGECLLKMGAKITGLGSPILKIEGVSHLKKAEHTVIPDRIEAGTFVLMGAMTGGRVRVTGCRPEDLSAMLDSLRKTGLEVEFGADWIETKPYDRHTKRPQGVDITTHPHPGFPTDLQAQWMALMSVAEGASVIDDTIYPDRVMHIPELNRLGANIRRTGSIAVVIGTKRLSGAEVTASDLRASAALVMAGLVAEGTTEVHRVYHLDRGYERFEARLNAVGAKIERVQDNVPATADA